MVSHPFDRKKSKGWGTADHVVLDVLVVDAGFVDDSVAAGFASAAGFDSVEGLPSATGGADESVAGFSAELDAALGA